MPETFVARNLTPLQEVRFVRTPSTETMHILPLILLGPLFPAAEDQRLRADPTVVVSSPDGQRWAGLEGWLRAPGEARMQCRRNGLTVALDARQDTGVFLLPQVTLPLTAAFVYTGADGQEKRRPLPAVLDTVSRSLRLTLPFEDTDAGHAVYGELVAAMSNPAAKAVAEVSYTCRYLVPAPTPRHWPHIFVHGTETMALNPGAAAAVQMKAVERTKVQPEMFQRMDEKVDLARISDSVPVSQEVSEIGIIRFPPKDPPPPQDPPPPVDTTFSHALRIDLFHALDDATIYPDLPRQQNKGWGQVPGREGRTPLHFRDSPQSDSFFYLPTRFRLGFYSEGSATLAPMRAELFAGDAGEERVRVTLVALPDIPEADRDALRTYLRDVVLLHLVPFVRLTPAGGLHATFASSFVSGGGGGAGGAQSLPAGIRFTAADVIPDKRLVLAFDMPAMDYAIFCELLRSGLAGQVLLADDGVSAGVDVSLRLDDVTTNALGIAQQGMEPGGTPTIKVDNLLDLPLELASLKVSLLDGGQVPGMVFDVEEQTLLTTQRFEPKAGTTAPVAPKRISSWDETVVTPPALRVDGGSVDDWLGRVHRDPSLQPQTFHVQVQPVIPAAGAARVQLIELHLYLDGNPTARLEPTLLPSAASFDLQVRMNLTELAGSAGASPTFSLEFDTLYTDGTKSLPQRIAVDPTTRTLPILVLVESPGATYRVQHDGTDEVLTREAATTLIDQLESPPGKHWQVFAIHPPAVDPGTGTGGTGTSGTTGTGGTGTTATGGTGTTGTTVTGGTTTTTPAPQVSIVTDLLAAPFDSGKLLKVFVLLQPLTAGAQGSTLQFDPAHRGAATWQPASGAIPPFAYKITYVFKDGDPKKVEGTEADLLLVLDPPA